jgi:uncharacterized membrane protein YgaE (UPF0421/DUF939 family)
MNVQRFQKHFGWKQRVLAVCLGVVVAICVCFVYPSIQIKELEKRLKQTPR